MPRNAIDYSNTIIYKLVHKEDYDNANIYIGSTTDFVNRKRSHKTSCLNEKDKGYNLKIYQNIRENGGWEEWIMVEIEKYPCNDGNEARAREEYWRCYFNANLNMCRAFRTEQERIEYHKIQDIKYKEYHKEILKEYRKDYYQNNKEKSKEYYKEYNKEKITCECGCIISKGEKNKHLKTKKHLDLIDKGV